MPTEGSLQSMQNAAVHDFSWCGNAPGGGLCSIWDLTLVAAISYCYAFDFSYRTGVGAIRRTDMPKSSRPDQPMSFEAALSELEKIVASMETGELSLEQSLAAHRRGRELGRYCQDLLAQAQQQVKILENNTLKNFPSGESES